MNETINNLVTRRSIRKYRSDMVSDEQLAEIIKAGTYAASGMGKQPVTMVVVTDKETRDQIEKLNAKIMGNEGATPFYGAPVVIVVLTDMDASHTAFYDGCLTMGNLMNAAHAVGVDSCWIHRAKETYEMPEGKELLKKWGLKETMVGIGNCILGYRDCEYPDPKPRREDAVVYIK